MYLFFKKQWFGILSLVISIALSSYMYLSSKIERVPVFLTDPVQTLVANGDKKGSEKISVVDNNSNLIEGDVIAIKFNFWNEGRHTIKSTDILEDLVLKLEGENVVIRDQNIIASTRDKVVSATLTKINDTSLNLNFKTLENSDGFSGQIIYSAKGAAKLSLSGDFEGVEDNEILNSKDLENRIFWRWYTPVTILSIIAILSIFGIIALFTKMTNVVGSKLNDNHKSKLQSLSKPIGITAGVIFFLGYMGLVTQAAVNGKALNEMPEKLKSALVDASNKKINKD